MNKYIQSFKLYFTLVVVQYTNIKNLTNHNLRYEYVYNILLFTLINDIVINLCASIKQPKELIDVFIFKFHWNAI